MRIDGKTSMETRHKNVKKFQEKDIIQVAILSLTAASTGINLYASSTVIFAEFHWTPGMMIQAEDRIHRIGQINSCNIH